MGKNFRIFAALFATLLFIAFVLFSYLVAKELFIQYDFDTTVKIQDRLSEKWIPPFSILSVIGTLEITGLLWLAIVIYSFIRRQWTFFLTLFLLPISQVIELYGKLFLLHPGPPFMFFRTQLPFHFPSGYVHTDYSYPSGHAIRSCFLVVVAFILATDKLRGLPRLLVQIGLLGFLSVMLLSRVYLGEHWATDVIGGAMMGTSFGIIAGLALTEKKEIIRRLQPSRRQQERSKKPAA